MVLAFQELRKHLYIVCLRNRYNIITSPFIKVYAGVSLLKIKEVRIKERKEKVSYDLDFERLAGLPLQTVSFKDFGVVTYP